MRETGLSIPRLRSTACGRHRPQLTGRDVGGGNRAQEGDHAEVSVLYRIRVKCGLRNANLTANIYNRCPAFG